MLGVPQPLLVGKKALLPEKIAAIRSLKPDAIKPSQKPLFMMRQQ
jgi:hypothetical protein